ncbi:MAG: hypothetical protein PVG65_01440 [Candidatus Thorarchaeota archaeon]
MELITYLIGQITANQITYEWRSDLVKAVEELPENLKSQIHLINPCGNQFSKKMLEVSQNDRLKFAETVEKEKQARLFPALDKGYVKKESNSCIFNANHYTPETPFLGTIFELAWYHDQPWKPVIGVFDGNYKEDYLCMHPFVQDTVHTWVNTPYEALELLISLIRS